MRPTKLKTIKDIDLYTQVMMAIIQADAVVLIVQLEVWELGIN